MYISPAQTYQEVQNPAKATGKLDVKLDAFLRKVKDIRGDIHDHETRPRALELGETEAQRRDSARLATTERRVAVFSGAAAVLGAGAGYLLRFLSQ
ncbi:hypothetical protein AB0I00_30330 [Streptomyces sp. NPDC050803]|uniref:hypothetical protein n=1 Tax=unclassified Streptomyces TaxID=2593676 RepID=UPI00343806E5